MRRFAALFAAIDGTNATSGKVAALAAYFAAAPAADAAWAVYFLTGRRLTRLLPGRSVSQWVSAATGISDWLLGECYAVVGDGAETAALVLDQIPASPAEDVSLAEWVEQRLLPLRSADAATQQARVVGWLRQLPRWERFTLLKVITGEFRAGVSHTLVVRALAEASGLPAASVAARLMGDWTPSAAWFGAVVDAAPAAADRSRPYPFFLAAPIDNGVRSGEAIGALLGERDVWQVEWKWDGIRAQIVRRDGHAAVWSRGEELITDRFPDVTAAAGALPDGTVLDGEILAFRDGWPLPFSALQQRIGRTRQVARAMRDVPVAFMAYDVLEDGGRDVRDEPLSQRRSLLESLVAAAAAAPRPQPLLAAGLPFEPPPEDRVDDAVLRVSPIVQDDTWDAIAERRLGARARHVEGVMLKRRDSVYGVGRRRADWWKWKIDPHTIDAVLIHAQPGSGKRASLLTDYTFGVWDGTALVPVAKAYSGLSNEEIAELDRWIRRHTLERYGPVRHVEPVHVFELGFEAIAPSSRHRSGIAVRFPRMLRWRRDKPAAEADTLDTLRRLLGGAGAAGARGPARP